ncbi:hypothetical protein [Mesorhizobium sp. KR2-14]|uniref:hypothetical protein n=1 Tax=Mesorhizobium sp. KR2-14 TaxID=3156610 RepID=UPI0032B5C413
MFSFVNLFFFHAAMAANDDRGKALPAGEMSLWKRQGGGLKKARTVALSCPRTPCPQGFFSGDLSIKTEESRRNLSHLSGKPESRPKRPCCRIWPIRPEKATNICCSAKEDPWRSCRLRQFK